MTDNRFEQDDAMKMKFWGVRGGIPVPGPSTAETGGNTLCVDLEDNAGGHAVFDMGTGVIKFGKSLLGGPCGKGQGEVHIFLTHTQWDHIQGFPYFIPGFIPGNKITFWGRSPTGKSLFDVLNGQMKAEYNPIFHLRNMGSTIEVREIGDGEVQFGEFGMRTIVLPHDGSPSTGYRVHDGNSVVVFLGDAHYGPEVPKDIVEFASGADILVHDAGEPGVGEVGFGVSLALAREARAKHLVITHYPPGFSDDDVRNLEKTARRISPVPVTAAYEGMTLSL